MGRNPIVMLRGRVVSIDDEDRACLVTAEYVGISESLDQFAEEELVGLIEI